MLYKNNILRCDILSLLVERAMMWT